MKVLVVGGAGYIGSHTVKKLIENGNEVVVVDNLETGHRESVPPHIPFYQVDIRNKTLFKEVFDKEKIDAVIHFAGHSQVGESMTNPLKYYSNNVYGSQVLLELLVMFGIKNIIFSSSAAVYGNVLSTPITEDAYTNPNNTYGDTKLAIEKMLYWTSKAHPIHYVSLRYFNAAGADSSGSIGEAHTPETHLIPRILEVPLGLRDYVTIFGNDYNTKDGTCIRDYIHVNDLASAHVLALNYLSLGGKSTVLNLGSNSGYSVLEIIEAAREVTSHPIPVVIDKRRQGDPAILIASSHKAKQILGWSPKMSDIKEIIHSAWHWHQSHPYGY